MRSSNPSRLYLPKKHSGLELPSISSSYQKLRASLCCQLLTSHNPVVHHTASMKIQREGALTKTLHKLMCAARDVMQCDPGANKRILVRRVKAYIMERETAKRLEHAKSMKHQSQLLLETEDDAAGIWSSAVIQLPPQVLCFSMNAAQDTLSHNANLSLWKKCNSLSDACKLCGQRQTLAHVLNQCPTSLHLRRYNIRHDAVLKVIVQGIQPRLPASYSMLADLPSTSSYTFPPHISLTSLRPDLVVWSDADRRVC